MIETTQKRFRRFLLPRTWSGYKDFLGRLPLRSQPWCTDRHSYITSGRNPVELHLHERTFPSGETELRVEHRCYNNSGAPDPIFRSSVMPPELAKELFCEVLRWNSPVELTRYSFAEWSVEVYDDPYKGLVLADIEVADLKAPLEFPEWFPKEDAVEVTESLWHLHLARGCDYLRHDDKFYHALSNGFYTGDQDVDLTIFVGGSALAVQKVMDYAREYDSRCVRAVPATMRLVIDQLDNWQHAERVTRYQDRHEWRAPDGGSGPTECLLISAQRQYAEAYLAFAARLQVAYEDAHLEDARIHRQFGVVIDYGFPDYVRVVDTTVHAFRKAFELYLTGYNPEVTLTRCFERYREVVPLGPFSEAMHREFDPGGREPYEQVSTELQFVESLWSTYGKGYPTYLTIYKSRSDRRVRYTLPETWDEVMKEVRHVVSMKMFCGP